MWGSRIPEARDHFDYYRPGADVAKHRNKGSEEVPVILSTPSSARATRTLTRYSDSPYVGVREVPPPSSVRNIPRSIDAA